MAQMLRVAAIMDEFTYNCYAPECELLQITPDGFQEEIDSFDPDLLFIESVWRGKDNLWRFKLHDNTRALRALTAYCRERRIPVIFWSKEDPVHFGVFLVAASLADYVFTTDADCIELYKTHLGHDRVYYLPFAAQPKLHNPIEEYERKDKFCFAGSFYVKYKERSKAFIELVPLFQTKGLDIYDRNYKKGETGNNSQSTSVASPVVENYYFPPELKDNILGGLPYSEISRAYKGYRYGVNMTSMVQSGYMFARRVFELLASNTVTVSNYSRGLTLFFGDLLVTTDCQERMKEQLHKWCGTEVGYRKYRLAGLRHVLTSHLYEDRLDRIAQKVLGRSIRRPRPEILVVCPVSDERVWRMFEAQTYERKRLWTGGPDVRLKDISFDYITIFSPQDYYGKNYLMDLALATRFAADEVIGKAAYYSGGQLLYKEKAYTRVQEPLQLTRQIAARSFIDGCVQISDLSDYHPLTSVLSLDEFNYCQNVKCQDAVDDLVINIGIPIERIYAHTDRIPPVTFQKKVPISIAKLAETVQIQDADLVKMTYASGALRLERTADDDATVWLRTQHNYELAQFTMGSRIGFFSEVLERTGNIRCQIEYYDENNVKLDFLNFDLDGYSLLRISDRAKSFKLIFRIRGRASVVLTALYAAIPDSLLPAPLPLAEELLITEHYPSNAQPEYFEGLHRFAKEKRIEVLLVGELPRYLPYSEYDGVQITAVQYEAATEYLATGTFKHIYVYSPAEKQPWWLSGYSGKIEAITL